MRGRRVILKRQLSHYRKPLHRPGLFMCRMQLAVWDMEGRLGVKPAFRFPMYKELMWHAAHHYLSRAQAAIRRGA